MSFEGYFDSVIKQWYTLEKRTPTLKRDMQNVIRQFQTSLEYGEIEESRISDLKYKFDRISREVYE